MKEFSRFMKPKTPLPCPKQLETGTYRELHKPTSRITPDFIMVELLLSFVYALDPRLVSYLLVFQLQLCVQISISSRYIKPWTFHLPSFEQPKNIWYGAQVLPSGSRGSGSPLRVSSRCIIHLFPFTDDVWMKSNSVLFFYEISNKYNTQFLYKLRKAGGKGLTLYSDFTTKLTGAISYVLKLVCSVSYISLLSFQVSFNSFTQFSQ